MNRPKYKKGMMNETSRTTSKKMDSSINDRFPLSFDRIVEKYTWLFFKFGRICIFSKPVLELGTLSNNLGIIIILK
jgi:hypothetical protein